MRTTIGNWYERYGHEYMLCMEIYHEAVLVYELFVFRNKNGLFSVRIRIGGYNGKYLQTPPMFDSFTSLHEAQKHTLKYLAKVLQEQQTHILTSLIELEMGLTKSELAGDA